MVGDAAPISVGMEITALKELPVAGAVVHLSDNDLCENPSG